MEPLGGISGATMVITGSLVLLEYLQKITGSIQLPAKVGK